MASVLLASCWASHTLLSYPTFQRLGVVMNRAVSTAVGATIITDVAALLVLVVVVGADGGDLDVAFFAGLLPSLAAAFAFILLVLPRIARVVLQAGRPRPDQPVPLHLPGAVRLGRRRRGRRHRGHHRRLPRRPRPQPPDPPRRPADGADRLLRRHVPGADLPDLRRACSSTSAPSPTPRPWGGPPGSAPSWSAPSSPPPPLAGKVLRLRRSPRSARCSRCRWPRRRRPWPRSSSGLEAGIIDGRAVNAVVVVILVTSLLSSLGAARFGVAAAGTPGEGPDPRPADARGPPRRSSDPSTMVDLASRLAAPRVRVGAAGPDPRPRVPPRRRAGPAHGHGRDARGHASSAPGAEVTPIIRLDLTPNAGLLHATSSSRPPALVLGWRGYTARARRRPRRAARRAARPVAGPGHGPPRGGRVRHPACRARRRPRRPEPVGPAHARPHPARVGPARRLLQGRLDRAHPGRRPDHRRGREPWSCRPRSPVDTRPLHVAVGDVVGPSDLLVLGIPRALDGLGAGVARVSPGRAGLPDARRRRPLTRPVHCGYGPPDDRARGAAVDAVARAGGRDPDGGVRRAARRATATRTLHRLLAGGPRGVLAGGVGRVRPRRRPGRDRARPGRLDAARLASSRTRSSASSSTSCATRAASRRSSPSDDRATSAPSRGTSSPSRSGRWPLPWPPRAWGRATASPPGSRTASRRWSPCSAPPRWARCSPRPAPTSAPPACSTASARSSPTVLFAVDGYGYGGRHFDRRARARRDRRRAPHAAPHRRARRRLGGVPRSAPRHAGAADPAQLPPPLVRPVLERHHRHAEVHRPRHRPGAAPARQGAPAPHRPVGRRPPALRHDVRLDDVELAGVRRWRGASRSSPSTATWPTRAPAASGSWSTSTASTCSASAPSTSTPSRTRATRPASTTTSHRCGRSPPPGRRSAPSASPGCTST